MEAGGTAGAAGVKEGKGIKKKREIWVESTDANKYSKGFTPSVWIQITTLISEMRSFTFKYLTAVVQS